MEPKQIIEEFYQSGAAFHPERIAAHLHAEVLLDWHSSKGFLQLNREALINMATDMHRNYEHATVAIQSIVAQGNTVALRYDQYAQTIENPSDEMLLGRFFAFWELRDGKLFRGYQMSQVS